MSAHGHAFHRDAPGERPVALNTRGTRAAWPRRPARETDTRPSRSPARWRTQVALAASALLVGTAVATGGTVQADTAPPNPNDPKTPRTVSADALPAPQIDGVAWEQTIVGGTVYVVGKFDKARPAGAAPGTHQVSRPNILAYDLDTGNLRGKFSPALNGQARTITASANGNRLYVGGMFTKVDGGKANRIVALDPQTGAEIKSFKVNSDATVEAIAVRGSHRVVRRHLLPRERTAPCPSRSGQHR